jgi:phosphotriesterase-related protein
MNRGDLHGKVQTVLGLISPEDLGITLPHEHFLIDSVVWFKEPMAITERTFAYQPVSLENLGWVRYNCEGNRDNIQLLDEQVAISEALRYKWAGGNSVVDLTNIGLGRDPLGLARISRATGLNIIMGSGYYIENPAKPWNLIEQMVTEEIVRDITVGVGNTGIRAGIIGEIGVSWPMRDVEKISLRAAAHAQKQTGAPLNVHSGQSPDSPFEIIEVLSSAGADINHVVISHIGRTIFDHDTRVKLAKTGCYLEYDQFSWEGYFPRDQRMVLSEANPVKGDLPNDAGRINAIMALIDDGFLNQILISHDCSKKHQLWRYGGPGYAHILQNVVSLMQDKDMPEEHIRALLAENPKRMLQFV